MKKSFEKYDNNGKDIDVYLVGSVKDKIILEQLKADLTRFNFRVMTTTDNLLPNQSEVNPDFGSNAHRIKGVIHRFSESEEKHRITRKSHWFISFHPASWPKYLTRSKIKRNTLGSTHGSTKEWIGCELFVIKMGCRKFA